MGHRPAFARQHDSRNSGIRPQVFSPWQGACWPSALCGWPIYALYASSNGTVCGSLSLIGSPAFGSAHRFDRQEWFGHRAGSGAWGFFSHSWPHTWHRRNVSAIFSLSADSISVDSMYPCGWKCQINTARFETLRPARSPSAFDPRQSEVL